MTKKKDSQKNPTVRPSIPEPVLTPITDTLKDNYMPYAMSVIISRAIPEIDGFKPSQRKLLYTMYQMNLLKGPRAKSADIVGQTMKLNPHGDQAIYETMVRMTRGNEALLNPWIDSKGNFGKVYSRDMQYAAYRYTEARLDASAEILFNSLEKDAVDFVDNYSGSMKEPLLLPAVLPTVLINANQGIAVGMASNIASFNLAEVCRATEALIQNPESDILSIMPAPDFSTGGDIIYDEDQMRLIYESGRGSFKIRAKAEIHPKEQRILLKEIPYNTSVEAIMEEITKQAKSGKLREVSDVRDETDLNGLALAIEYRRSADPELLLAKLYQATSMESTFSCNFNVLINGRPQVCGVSELLLEWLEWRRACYRRELSFDKNTLLKKLHLLKALEAILLDIDYAIRIIRRTEKEADVIPHLMEAFHIDEAQAEYVAEIKLRHLNREYLLRRTDEISGLESEIERLEGILNSQSKLDREIAKQLKTGREKFGKERKTRLIAAEAIEVPDKEDMIDDYRLKFFFTKEGYIKKLPLTSLRSAGELKLKEDDEIIQEYEGSNLSELLFFSDKAQVYKLKAYEIEDHKPSEIGDFIRNLLELDGDEKILFMHLCSDAYEGRLLLAFSDGRAVKIDVSAYQTRNRRKKLLNAFYDGAKLIGLYPLDEEGGERDFLMISSKQRMILFDGALVPLKRTRTSRGIQVMSPGREQVVTQILLPAEEDLESLSYYRVRRLPAAGRYIRDSLEEERQLRLEDI